jgi:acyl carrier protein
MQPIYDKLTIIMRDILDEEDLVATSGLSAIDVDSWDSLSNIQIIVAVEKEYGIRFTAAEMSALKNVGEFAALISEKVSRK